MDLQLSVWYGILFRSQATVMHPNLPSWTLDMLGSGADYFDMAKELETRGYRGADELAWIPYTTNDPGSYYGLAIDRSVQHSADRIGEILATDDISERWLDSLGQAAQILGCHSAVFSWFQTARYLP